MKKLQTIVRFWGAYDLLFIAWWLGWWIIKGQIPVYIEVKTALNTSVSFGNYIPLFLTLLVLIFYISIIYSGLQLLKLSPRGAVISYFQFPFRLFTATPSLFFASYFLRYVFSDFKQFITISVIVLICIELSRLVTLILWHKNLRKNFTTTP